MPLVNRKRPRIGDVIEIPTPRGFACAQYTHKHATNGALIRILPAICQERPSDFAALVQQPPLFSTFFPLGAACNRKIFSVVAAEALAPHACDFPTFRNCSWYRDPAGQLHVSRYHLLWDGQREWRVESLSTEQLREYPPLSIPNDTLLVERILTGWRHEDDPPNA